ncbi:MAG: U32 family peptidase [Clostridiales bacterium]|jgi:putative protease|nr:U32 family peptidase [Clostridiales bacterium]
MNNIELLAPAGSIEKLKIAIDYGADSVYIGGKNFSLRNAASNFDFDEMKKAVDYAHAKDKKVYLAANIIPHNEEIKNYPEFIKNSAATGIDAVIVSDLGIFEMTKEFIPKLDIHISTQANNVNWLSCKKWYQMGAKRIILARELHLDEIKEIRENTPIELELETFVHGAMCISYSGRCLLSKYMVNRNSNLGDCAQPCRWKYYLMEENRPGDFFGLVGSTNGSYVMNSKDLCMINHIDSLIKAGVFSLKIEGRMKSEYYVSTVVKTYKEAINVFLKNPDGFKIDKSWMEELEKISNREYTTGFYFKKPDLNSQNYKSGSYVRKYDLIGIVKVYDKDTKIASIILKNKLCMGDKLEVFTQKDKFFTQKVYFMENSEGEKIEVASVAQNIVKIKIDKNVNERAIIRKLRH